MPENIVAILPELRIAVGQTALMLAIGLSAAVVLGGPLGIWLFLLGPGQSLANRPLFGVINWLVNMVRSFPFIILLVALVPVTRVLVGSSIGPVAAAVPLSFAAIPYFARLVEQNLREVPRGVIEAAHSMGATEFQIIGRVLLASVARRTSFNQPPPTLPSMPIASLTRRRAGVALLALAATLGQPPTQAQETIRIAVTAGPHAQIAEAARQVAARDGLTLKIVEFQDYIQPNAALDAGDVEANSYQHLPFLESQIKARGYKLTAIGNTVNFPMGIYLKRVKSLGDLKPGAKVGIPNDPSNSGRGLQLLAKYGVVTLKPGAGVSATVADVVENPKRVQIIQIDAAQLPRSLDDLDAAAIGDPIPLVAAMAAVTRHLGFGVTVNLSYEQPYLLARRFSTLDHLSRGRIGWNVVTGYLDSAARAMGLAAQPEHDARYDRADEFMEVVYKLWEGSWDDDAVVRDRANRVYARPDRVWRIVHEGPHFRVDGVHLAEPSPQRTPVLYQAGSSGRGQRFAARHAECVFISGQTVEAARGLVTAVRDAAEGEGRRREDVKVFMGATVVTAASDAEAQEKLADYLHHANPEAGLAHFASGTGIDFSHYGLDDPIAPPGGGRAGQGNAMHSAVKLVTGGPAPKTKRQLLAEMAIGGRYPLIVGSASRVADELMRWVTETGVDGFNLARTVTPECFEDIVVRLVPELQHRGAYKTAYAEGALRQKLFGAGDRLPQRHAAAGFRRPAA